MSSPNPADVFFAELAQADAKILQELDNVHDDEYDKKLAIFAKRADLYRQLAEQMPDPYIKQIVYAKRESMFNTIAIINSQKTINSDIAKIMSRLDELESKSKSE
jgi:hypothetical protein